jgi:diadenosine tetraphosphate (Ap4A) HIT family hydrolase
MAVTKFDPNCFSCQALQGKISLTNVPRILETDHWIVEHVTPTCVKGWLVLVLKRHAEAIHQMRVDELNEFGRLLLLICQALHQTLHTEKEYVIQLAESEGFNHVHFHIIARLPDWPDELGGTEVFSGIGDEVKEPLNSEELAPIAYEIKSYLQEGLDIT